MIAPVVLLWGKARRGRQTGWGLEVSVIFREVDIFVVCGYSDMFWMAVSAEMMLVWHVGSVG